MNDNTRIKYEKLLNFTQKCLEKIGLDEFSIDAVSTGLCQSSLRGVDSHGIRLLPHYIESGELGRKNPRPNFKFKQSYPSMGCLDADNAFGHSAGFKAIDHCIELASKTGVGIVGVQNSSHCGAMATFALKAAEKGLLAFAFTHADALVRAHNATSSFFGTNPICMAAPREKDEPFCLDMATSTIAWNKVLLARQNDQLLPENTASDKNGNQTCDPFKATQLEALGGYKGFGLGAMVEILCSVFTGMAYGPNIPAMFTTPREQQRKLGQFYMVFKADACISEQLFKNVLQEISNEVRRLEVKENVKSSVLLPGDLEIKCKKERLSKGIPLDLNTMQALNSLSKRFELPLEFMESI